MRQLNQILEFKRAEGVQQASKEMQTSLNVLGSCNKDSLIKLSCLANQTEALTDVQRGREKDSKTVKALTSISTLYLPASLVATVFSSNLVQLTPVGSKDAPVRFAPVSQSWIPVIITTVLVCFTFLAVKSLESIYSSASKKRASNSEV